MDEIATFIAYAGSIGTALVGGTLFVFTTLIMAALERAPDAEGMRIMQQIDRTMFTPRLNPCPTVADQPDRWNVSTCWALQIG
ncbi:MAG: hypothetical protein AAGB48_05680 [Planctomycetota bacterium]